MAFFSNAEKRNLEILMAYYKTLTGDMASEESKVDVTGDYTVAGVPVIYVDASAGDVAITLVSGLLDIYTITRVDNTTNTVTLMGTVNGTENPELLGSNSAQLGYNGTDWSLL